MRVSIIGGTGFVGSSIASRLSNGGHEVSLLVRPGSEGKVDCPQCLRVSGDLGDDVALGQLLKDSEVVIYSVGLLREFPGRGITFQEVQADAAQRVVELAEKAGARHFLLLSANGVEQAGTAYQRTKLAAEEALRNSALQWTILRPSVIFGDPRGRMEFASQLLQDVIRPPIPAPLFFEGINPLRAGEFLLSPVHVQNVSELVARILDDPARGKGRVLELGGPVTLSWKQILQTIAKARGKSKWMLPAPVLALGPVAAVFDRYAWFPFTRDQLSMLLEGNVADDSVLLEFGIKPVAFSEENLSYLCR
jgi:NADH dehydrogenase